MRESTVERYLHRQVVLSGGWTDKFSSPGRANVPDRIVTWPGMKWHGSTDPLRPRASDARIHFVECKAPGKTARAGQKRDHARRRKMSCRVFVLYPTAQVAKYDRENA